MARISRKKARSRTRGASRISTRIQVSTAKWMSIHSARTRPKVAPARRRMLAAGDESGFTLLEILVVMGLMALIAMVAAPDIEHALDLMQLRETAGALQANLRVIRSDALRSDQPVVFSLSSDRKGYAWSEGEVR